MITTDQDSEISCSHFSFSEVDDLLEEIEQNIAKKQYFNLKLCPT